MRVKILIFLFYLCYSGITCMAQQDTAINFSVTDTEGNTHVLYDYLDQGHFVLIDFFGTSCFHCENLVPELNKVFIKYGCNKSELIILGINDDRGDQQIKEFKEEFNAVYPSASGFEGGGKAVFDSYEITYLPRLIIVSPDRIRVVDDISKRTFENIDTILQSLHVKDSLCDPAGIIEEKKQKSLVKLSVQQNMLAFSSTKTIHEVHLYNIYGQLLFKEYVGEKSGQIPFDGYGEPTIFCAVFRNEFFVKKLFNF